VSGSNNVIYINSKVPNLIINGSNNKIISRNNNSELNNVILNGSNTNIISNDINFNKINNGSNNILNGQMISGLGNSFNVNNNFPNCSFNININNNDFSSFSNNFPFENLMNNLNNFNFGNNNFNFSSNNNNNNANNVNINYNEDFYSDENYDDEEEYYQNEEEEEEENEENDIEKRNEIILELNEFQFKHVKKYIKRIDENCSICLEKFKGTDVVKQFACGQHIFHKKCLINWLKKSNICPLCKYDLMNGIAKDNTYDD